ncbi:MAG: hypothetical protein GY851_06760 [bacterium]|nr:hypothetical protein [bacterium]
MLYQPGTQITVPAGSYIPAKYRALRNDEQGDLWGLVAYGTGNTPASDLSDSGGTVAFGAPFTPTVDISPHHVQRVKAGQMTDLPMNLNIRGQAHEQVIDIAHMQGRRTKLPLSGRRPKEAKYKIVKADGKVVTQGTFEYG